MSDIWATIIEGKEFSGAKPGEIYPTNFVAGDVVDGELANIAIAAKKAEKGKGDRPLDPEQKMLAGAPENKDNGAIGERLVYLQGENAKLETVIDQQGQALAALGVDNDFVEKLKTGEVAASDLADFAKKIEATRAASATIIEQQSQVLAVLGVDNDFVEKLKTKEVAASDLADFAKKIEATRAASATKSTAAKK